MRKRDKKKEKARLEAREQKKREVYVDVSVTGAKRGKGHRQRVSARWTPRWKQMLMIATAGCGAEEEGE